mgnify:CR=1 FL=1
MGALPYIAVIIIKLANWQLFPLVVHDYCACVDVATEYLILDLYVAVCPVSDFPLHLAGWEGFASLFWQ